MKRLTNDECQEIVTTADRIIEEIRYARILGTGPLASDIPTGEFLDTLDAAMRCLKQLAGRPSLADALQCDNYDEAGDYGTMLREIIAANLSCIDQSSGESVKRYELNSEHDDNVFSGVAIEFLQEIADTHITVLEEELAEAQRGYTRLEEATIAGYTQDGTPSRTAPIDSDDDEDDEDDEDDDEEQGLIAGHRIQHDRSGRGRCWYDISRHSLPSSVVEEITGDIIDGKNSFTTGYTAANGETYRWE